MFKYSNLDRLEGLEKLAGGGGGGDHWSSGLFPEKNLLSGGNLPSNLNSTFGFGGLLSSTFPSYTSMSFAGGVEYTPSLQQTSSATMSSTTSRALHRPFQTDEDSSNLSLLSAAAFFFPKDFFSELLLSQYLFKTGT